MPPRKKPEPLTPEAIVARSPRVLRYLADVLDSYKRGDAEYSLEAPTDLPMDEATFVATIYAACELADAADVDSSVLRKHAESFERALVAPPSEPPAEQSPAEPAPAPAGDCKHDAVKLNAAGDFECTDCGTVMP